MVTKLVGFWNKEENLHRTFPVKNIRYVEEMKGGMLPNNTIGETRFFVKVAGVDKRIEISKDTAKTIVDVMERA